ncbi:MAG: glucuronate isomerase, partial [Pedobacter sp.]|nr:glucuronate isomerase [Pedobacter sp.]
MKEGNVIAEDFLLTNKTAELLYNDYAKHLPIIDYHNHLPPDEIATNKQFNSLTDIWLRGDHYKWRGMRALGVEEKYITGSALDKDKFAAWAKIVPSIVRNPLFHWTHMELKNPFGINNYLNADSAESIYESCNELLKEPAFFTQGLLMHFNVKMVGTTDDPCDDLQHHIAIRESNFQVVVKPSFRPDKALMIGNPGFRDYILKLSRISEIEIKDIDTLLIALAKRLDYFEQNNCSISDHGLSSLPLKTQLTGKEEQEFRSFLKSENTTFSNPDAFAGHILTALCKLYHQKGWVQQFHLGAIRNNNLGMLSKLGADSGYDSIGDFKQAERMSAFLGNLSLTDQLAKTVVYNL